jgi:hypothetical protein
LRKQGRWDRKGRKGNRKDIRKEGRKAGRQEVRCDKKDGR